MIENSSKIRLLNALKNSWLESGNKEAEERGKYLAKILDENAQNVVMEKWNSYLRCDPPKEVKPLLQNELKRYLHPN